MRRWLAQDVSLAAVEAMGPILLAMIVGDMTRQIPAAALPYAAWSATSNPMWIDEDGGVFIASLCRVSVGWPDVVES